MDALALILAALAIISATVWLYFLTRAAVRDGYRDGRRMEREERERKRRGP